MPLYLITVDRPKQNDPRKPRYEETMREYHKNTFVGSLYADNNIQAMKKARDELFKDHPERLLFKATAFGRSNEAYKNLFNKLSAKKK